MVKNVFYSLQLEGAEKEVLPWPASGDPGKPEREAVRMQLSMKHKNRLDQKPFVELPTPAGFAFCEKVFTPSTLLYTGYPG